MGKFNEESAFKNNTEPEIWDEFQWEKFMRESDKRTEKYSRLIEKYAEHPDRDQIIAVEMGWDHLLDESEGSDRLKEFTETDDSEEGEEWKKATGFEPTIVKNFEKLPVYQLAFDFSIDCFHLLESYTDIENDESVKSFMTSATIPPAKIAGGFAMGFEQESLGGNIANCKRGLHAANRTLTALQELRDKGILEQEIFQYFHRRAKEVRDELGIYIVELRERFHKGIP